MLEPLAYLVVKWWSLPFPSRALAGVVVRPVLATAGMALAVLWVGPLVVAPAYGQVGVGSWILQLVMTVLVGAVSYFGLILALWWTVGRPMGIEADVLNMLQRRRGGTVGVKTAHS
jgi:hypothetical protein